MSNIKHSVEELIGNTPLFQLDNYVKTNGLNANIFLKVESVNILGSLKDRIAVAMIDALERDTDIKPGDYIVEASSGNTVIALAAIGRKRGYKVLAIVEQATPERINLLKAYGAEIIDIADDPELLAGMGNLNENYKFHDFLNDYYGKKSAQSPHHYYVTAQWANAANREVQYRTTGKEIINDLDGKIDVFIGGVGSGGSLRGISDALREVNPNVEIIAIDSTAQEPDSLVGIHKIQGTPDFFLPVHITEKEKVYDRVITVTKEEAYAASNAVAKAEGTFFGITTGAAVHIASQLAKEPGYAGKNIVAIAYDDVLKYLSTDIISEKYRN